MSFCEHEKCSEPRIKFLKKVHYFLCTRLDWYHNWHHHQHHQKIHTLALGFNILLIASIMLTNLGFGGKAMAANGFWNFSDANYSVSSDSLVQFSENNAGFKVREYASDEANTTALFHLNGNANDARGVSTTTVTGGSWTDNGKLNGGLSLNGTSDKISVNDTAAVSPTRSMSIEAWTKFNTAFNGASHNQHQGIADKGDYQLYYDNETGKITYEIKNGSTWAMQGGSKVKSSWGSDPLNLVKCITEDNDYVYAGVSGDTNVSPRPTGEVWRFHKATSVWSKIGGPGALTGWTAPNHSTIHSLIMVGTDLYAGIGGNDGDAEIWKWNGSVWSKFGGDGTGWTGGTSVYSMIAVGNVIYAGLNGTNAPLYKYDGSWSIIGGGSPVVNSSWTNKNVVSSLAYSTTTSTLYAGLGWSWGSAQVWKLTSGTWSKIGSSGQGWGADFAYIDTMVAVGGDLYIGTGTGDAVGAVVLRWNGVGWETVGGFSELGNPESNVNGSWNDPNWNGLHYRVKTLALSNDSSTLYAGVSTSSQSAAQIWAFDIANTTWTQVGGTLSDNPSDPSSRVNGGFDPNDGNVNGMYFSSSGKLYAGLADAYSVIAGVWSWDLSGSWQKIGGQLVNGSWGYYGIDGITHMTTGGGKLYAGLGFSRAGNAQVWEFDNSNWRIIGGQGLNHSWAPEVYEDVTSMAFYKDSLYVGLGNSNGGEGEVWKWDSQNQTWGSAPIGGDNANSSWNDTDYQSIDSMFTLGDTLYAGLGGDDGDSEVWSYNGTSWAKIGGDGGSSWPDLTYTSVTEMTALNGTIYAGLSGSDAGDAEVWRYDGGTSWTKVGGDTTANSWANATYEELGSLTVYNGEIYAGLGNSNGDAEVWKYNGSTWSKIGGDSLNSSWDDSHQVVKSMAVYNGDLYASLGNYSGQGKVYRWDAIASTWSMVGGDISLANNTWTGNTYMAAYALTVYEGQLFVGLYNVPYVYSYGSNAVLHSNSVPNDNNWHHVAATYDGSTMKIFIDGVESTSLAINVAIPDSNKPLLLGTTYGSTKGDANQGYFNGVLDEVRISDVARTQFNATKYTTDPQTIRPSAPTTSFQVKSWDTFIVDADIGTGCTLRFRLSDNNGSSWKYWFNDQWSGSELPTDSSTVTDINNHISSLSPYTPAGLLWQAVMQTNGENQITLRSVRIDFTQDTDQPANPTSVIAKSTASAETTFTDDGNYRNFANPYFEWSGATDTINSVEGSGIDGYYVYFGTVDSDTGGNPEQSSGILTPTSGSFRYQTGSSITIPNGLTSGTYYLRIKTKDKARNISNTSKLFTYKYDGNAPTMFSSSYLTVTPAGYSATNDFTFRYPNLTDGGHPTDTGGSGLSHYEYKVNNGGWLDLDMDSEARQKTFTDAIEGTNIFYIRVIDMAGNASSPAQITFLYSATGLKAPRDLAVSPNATNPDPLQAAHTNDFTFSWNEPNASTAPVDKYYYAVNPEEKGGFRATAFSSTAGRSVEEKGTRQGQNIFYVIAKDTATTELNDQFFAQCNMPTNGGIVYDPDNDKCARIAFYIQTPAPSFPTALQAVDGSNRDTGDFKIFLTWNAPSESERGVGSLKYHIYISEDGIAWTESGATSDTTYAKSGLTEGKKYYFKATAVDGAGQASRYSDPVNITPTGKFANPPRIKQDTITVDKKAYSTTISWETVDNDPKIVHKASSFIEYGLEKDKIGKESGGETKGQLSLTDQHSVRVLGLRPDTDYYYRLVWVDQDGNKGTYEMPTPIRSLPRPTASKIEISNVTLNSVTIQYETSVESTTAIYFGTSKDAMVQKYENLAAGFATNHTINLTGLSHSTTYYYSIKGDDTDDNPIDIGAIETFSTLTMPKIDGAVQADQDNEAPTTTYRFSWKTNVPTSTVVTYRSLKTAQQSKATAELTTDHSMTVSDLADMSTYVFGFSGIDKNGLAVENPYTTEINTPKDTRAPKLYNITVEIRSSGVSTTQKAQLVVSWETDEPSTSQVEYDKGISSSQYSFKSQEDTTLTTNHVVIVSELDPAKLYHLRAVSRDASGNLGSSTDTTAITGKIQRSVIDLIMNSLEKSLNFLTKIPFLRGN